MMKEVQKRQMALEAASKMLRLRPSVLGLPMRSGSNASSTDDLSEEAIETQLEDSRLHSTEIRFDKNGNEVPTQNHESLEAMAMAGSPESCSRSTYRESANFATNSKMCNA